MRVPIPEPPDNPTCFACSSQNPDGMHLTFFREGDLVLTEFTAPPTWSGWGDILHGGFQSLLLDEVCSWAYATLAGGRSFVTARLEVAFRRPARVSQRLTATGRLIEHDDRRALLDGQLLDPEGRLLSEAQAEMRVLSPERFQQVAGQSASDGPFRRT